MEVSFILNQETVSSAEPSGKVLVDLIRKDFAKKGTTVACREGDCGACTVLAGELQNDRVYYRSLTSCISPWVNASGLHIVTVEGLSQTQEGIRSTEVLNPLQEIFRDCGATQCGYCTPGFLVSLSGFLLRSEEISSDEAITAIDGNICRCTGYKSIERAVEALVNRFREKSGNSEHGRLQSLISLGLIPAYFREIPGRLKELALKKNQESRFASDLQAGRVMMGGGTDLLVQKPDEICNQQLCLSQMNLKNDIREKDGRIQVGASCRIEDFRLSPLVNRYIPAARELFRLFASTQIRHQGTVAGNIVNASPIGDMTNFLLALDSDLHLDSKEGKRTVALSEFYKGYKSTALGQGEWISHISFKTPGWDSRINLEKVSKRTFLDIASVTTSMHLRTDGRQIHEALFSAGGVGPVPMLLRQMSVSLTGQLIGAETVKKAVCLGLEEVAPLSDVRGSRDYKLLLLRQLLYAHFVKIFPEKISLVELVS